jgi:lipopolysaccharide biosynthesis protein
MLIRLILTKIEARILRALYCRHAIIGNLRRLRNHLRDSWLGADPLRDSHNEAVYVHYDRHGVVHGYVLEQLRALVAAGFRITFVSNAPTFTQKNVSEIAAFCRQILWRRNVGLDFGAYKDGIEAVGDLAGVERLLLMNDSVYGPLYPLTSIVAAIDPLNTDFWGISDSWEHCYHIQSYFMIFFQGALQSSAFGTFWKNFPYVNNKHWIIRHGEVELSQALIRNKLRANVLAPFWQVAKVVMEKISRVDPDTLAPAHKDFLDSMFNRIVRGLPVNPSHHFWETMVAHFGCPFVKRDLIMWNPAQIPYTWRWAEIISQYSDYDPSLIERHLRAN